MSLIFCGFLWTGFLFAAFFGRMPALSEAMLNQSRQAVELTLTLLGSFCFWGGLMKVARRSGLDHRISLLFSPLLSLLFPRLRKGGAARAAISANLTASLLGLGNAVTPLGISALREMDRERPAHGVATKEMITLVVMNTASLQLLPTTVGMLRMAAGGKPFDLIIPIWIASLCSVTAGILAARWGGRGDG